MSEENSGHVSNIIGDVISPGLGAIAEVLAPKVETILAERRAGKHPYEVQHSKIDRRIDESLTRIREIDKNTAWWTQLVQGLGRAVGIPEHLKKPAISAWLGNVQVASDFSQLTKASLFGDLQAAKALREKLSISFEGSVGEDQWSSDH